MSSAGKQAEQAARGEHARRLLEDPLIREFFDKMEAEALSAWKESAGPDADLREQSWRMFKAVERLRGCFTVTIKTGEVATKQLLERQSATRNDK